MDLDCEASILEEDNPPAPCRMNSPEEKKQDEEEN
jgi:hypothetical protein